MNIVKSIRIQNFKSLEDVTIDLSQLTLLFGANSSGKSSFLKALMFLERNLYPINKGKTVHKLGDHFDLGSFEDIVSKNDKSRVISYDFTFSGKFPFPDFSIYDGTITSEDSWVKYYIEEELPKNSFFNFFQLIRDHDSIDVDMFSKESEFNCTFSVDFKYSDSGKHLSRISIKDRIESSSVTIRFSQKPDSVRYDFPEIDFEFMGNRGLTELFNIALFTSSQTSESTGTFLFDRHIFYNDVTIENLLSDSFNKKPVIHFKKENEIRVYPDWDNFDDNEKLRLYYEIMKFIYLSYFYVPIMLKILLSVVYFPQVRETPSKKYILSNDEFEGDPYYGYMNLLKKDSFNHVPDIPSNSPTYIAAVNELLEMLMPGHRVSLECNTDVGSLILHDEKTKVNMSTASSGTIQILPILIAMAIRRVRIARRGIKIKNRESFVPEPIPPFEKGTTEGPTLLLEQPELHLHPRLQSKLADVFKEYLKSVTPYYGTLFIETHSEHLIRKLQVLIAKGELAREKVGVWYFKKVNGVTKVEKMEIDENGLFKKDWPDGFFDDSIELTMELFEALRKRKN